MSYPPAILAIGRNYAEHAREMGGAVPERPVVFMKNPASVVGDGAAVIIPAISAEGGDQIDFEGELAVIIGSAARDVPEEQALAHVRGYAAANDVTDRWWQKHGSGGQFVRGKSFDTFCPLGAPVSASAVPDPQDLVIRTVVSGETMQEASTGDMLLPVARIIAELSRGMTLLPGTLILTGTPPGVGAGRTPPRWLRAGDVVEVSIEGVGRVRNPVGR
jgi:2-keto-4-pentenoate hydratase/2-oxohepta-3-ene-1,7-dioic acid hydratase in catechol pathway